MCFSRLFCSSALVDQLCINYTIHIIKFVCGLVNVGKILNVVHSFKVVCINIISMQLILFYVIFCKGVQSY